jgi:hypothetical protein
MKTIIREVRLIICVGLLNVFVSVCPTHSPSDYSAILSSIKSILKVLK